MTSWMYRQWKVEREANPNISAFENWIKDVVRNHPVDPNDEDDIDRVLMCSRPSQLATRYTRMKAYGNHFRVEDQQSRPLKTYDSSVASVFHMPSVGSEEVTLNYVGVLKDILKLNYGPIRTPVILLRCEWMKQFDNRGNPTYVRDEAGFMVVNFRHKVPQMLDPFIFPSQATQVFWSDEVRKPGWKVVLAKEARSQRYEHSTQDVFMTTSEETDGMQLANHVPPPPTTASLVGAIELSETDNSLAMAKF
jgi:hypothetical protein